MSLMLYEFTIPLHGKTPFQVLIKNPYFTQSTSLRELRRHTYDKQYIDDLAQTFGVEDLWKCDIDIVYVCHKMLFGEILGIAPKEKSWMDYFRIC